MTIGKRTAPWAALIMAMALCVAPATAQTLDDHWKRCEDKNADIRIGGCTSVIQSGQETTANVAIAHIKRGLAYSWKGDLARALQDYDQAIRVDPANADAFYNRGITHRTLGQVDRAIQDYDRAIRLRPTYSDAIYNRGFAYATKGQHERAIQDFDHVLRLEPSAADARSSRCDSLKALGRAC